MPRINLSLEQDLYDLLMKDAQRQGCTINVYLISLLKKIYKQNPFDYAAALRELEAEALAQPIGAQFTLADLPSYRRISVAEAANSGLKPSTVRARLGRMWNSRVAEGEVGSVKRARLNGELVFINRTAVYVREEEK